MKQRYYQTLLFRKSRTETFIVKVEALVICYRFVFILPFQEKVVPLTNKRRDILLFRNHH